MYHSLQVLHSWFQNTSSVPLGYTVENFLQDVDSWCIDGYVSNEVWLLLKKHVNHELIGTKVKLQLTHYDPSLYIASVVCLINLDS